MIINEEAARRSKENMSFRDYKPGSATAEYREYCREADEQAAKYPDNPKAQEAAERYKAQIGNWLNKSNARGAGHVSVMICGPSNYNMKKHEKWMAAEDKGWDDYNAINHRFESAMHAAIKPIIHDGDTDAVDKLKAKLAKEEEYHIGIIANNKKARSKNPETAEVAPAYMLQNSNGRLKNLRDRIQRLEKAKAQPVKEVEVKTDLFTVIENTEIMRLQLLFDGKPSADIRTILKSNGFKWAPSKNAWQRQLTNNARYSLKRVIAALDKITT